MGTHSWTVAEAKEKFSEVIERARSGGPQTITRNGRLVVVLGGGGGMGTQDQAQRKPREISCRFPATGIRPENQAHQR
jgi:antitoxin (DNA-binding transcriptional repressor) of toxin-antitoxin stability system